MSKNIMIDLETLSTSADAVILSIGAVKFDLEGGKIDDKGFYGVISIDSNTESGRHISESTLKWWMGQGDAAKKLFNEPAIHIKKALELFVSWAYRGGYDDYTVWGNGADFDIAILAHAFHTHGMEAPWKFWNTKCFRTYKNLPGAPKCTTPPAVKHHALYDALSQAQHAVAIHAALFGKKV